MAGSSRTNKQRGSTPEQHPIMSVFHQLVLLGVDPADVCTNFEPDEHTHVSIAIPNRKFAICFENDRSERLEQNHWVVQKLNYNTVVAFHTVFQSLDEVRIAESYARADKHLKTTSQPEEWLWEEMVKQNITPMPDRNRVFRRDDGSELTTPDFTWETHRIAFFMDGHYWHSVKGDREIMRDIAASKQLQNHIVDTKKDKSRRDGAIRSELAAQGWIVLSCTDEDLQEDGGPFRVVKQIQQAITTQQQLFSHAATISDQDLDLIEDLL